MEKEITNKIEQSGLIEINLDEFYPSGERAVIDVKDNLFQGLILKEKDFREYVKTNDWARYQDKFVAITCTADAIVPTWAYMLIAAALQPYAKKYVFGNLNTLETVLFNDAFSAIDPEKYRDKKVMVKGCGNVPVPESAFVEIVSLLSPVASSVMFGEACSTVPVYKKKA